MSWLHSRLDTACRNLPKLSEWGYLSVSLDLHAHIKIYFITYLLDLVIMQNVHGVILATSQLPISARVQNMHINDVTMKKYVTTNKFTVKYFRILSSFITAILAW
jgi:hypothetical protein